ncbi:hypothetical protein FZEAL_1238 [Fusarium zealandicum]|uniref:Uncharacterized protein n=1 Tax=Fusarium zealandicum TaxID=1053134 RepID=A0A8H4XPN3_9HYPO|nr:hypothetical protein FZEAL_1238 [Fusarium zealandicum]
MSSQKTALVTGTSKGGIGDYLARELHGRGFRVFATARSPAKVQHLKEMGLDIVMLEVTDSESIKRAAEEVNELTGGRLDILINNSGFAYMSPLLDTDIAGAKACFDVNVWGVLEVTRAFTPMLIASKGTIINIGSVVGRVPLPFQGIYNISKAALEHLSRQLRVELSPFDIKVVHVVTGGINTAFFSHHTGDTTIAETSYYYPGREYMASWTSGEAGEALQTTPPEEFAKGVVDNALKSSPTACHYVGFGSFATWLVSRVLWYTSTDLLMWIMGIPNIKKALASDRAGKKAD